MVEYLVDHDQLLSQFNRFMQDLFRENITRTCFRPWEIELLLDIQGCRLREASKRDTLRRYQRMVQKHLEKAKGPPEVPKLSDFLMKNRGRRNGLIEVSDC